MIFVYRPVRKQNVNVLSVISNSVPGQQCFWESLYKMAAFQIPAAFSPLCFPVNVTEHRCHGVAFPPLFVLALIELFKMFAVLYWMRTVGKRMGWKGMATCVCVCVVLDTASTRWRQWQSYVNTSGEKVDTCSENKVGRFLKNVWFGTCPKNSWPATWFLYKAILNTWTSWRGIETQCRSCC